ncbi:MAG: NAD(P)-binding domain-containing protein [Nitrososphaerales archaeon]
MPSIGFIGGTGDLGTALAVQLSANHESVTIGSRSSEKAKSAVRTILEEKSRRGYLLNHLKAGSNREVVSTCDLVILTVPHEKAIQTIKELSNDFRGTQVLVSAVAVLSKIGSQFFPSSSESVAKQIRSLLPPSVEVASAFQTLPATMLYEEREISADVLVSAESVQTYEKVAKLISSMRGLRPLYLGDLELAGELERLTALLLNLATRNGLKSPTLKISSF